MEVEVMVKIRKENILGLVLIFLAVGTVLGSAIQYRRDADSVGRCASKGGVAYRTLDGGIACRLPHD